MNEKILVVEDNQQNMRLVTMILKSKGYSLLTATDGEKALDTAIRGRPDLIIMDMQIPKKNGFEVTRKLRQMPEFNHIPIIAITAYAMKGDREKCIEAGCDIYVPKPIDTRTLPEIIAAMLPRHRQ